MTEIDDPRFFWDEDFGKLFFEIRDRAYDLLPEESDDEDIAKAVATAIAEREQRGPIDWASTRVPLGHWIDPCNIYTLTDSLVYLPEGFAQKLSELPEHPDDPGPYREALSAIVIAQLTHELDQAEDDDPEDDEPEGPEA